MADFPQNTVEHKLPNISNTSTYSLADHLGANLSVPAENYSTSVTDMQRCQRDEFDECATGTESLNHF